MSQSKASEEADEHVAQLAQYDSKLVAKLWPFIKPYRRYLGLFVIAVLVTAACGLARPLLMQKLIDWGVLGKKPQVLAKFGIALTMLVVVEQAVTFLQIYMVQIVGARSMTDLRRFLFQKLHALRMRFFDVQPIGRLVTRVTNDVDAINEAFASGALNALGDLIRLVGIVVCMLALDWRLSLIAFAALPPVIMLAQWIRKRMRTAFREIRSNTARMNAIMNEHVSGISVIQAYCHETEAAREFDEVNRLYLNANVRSIKFEAMQDAAVEMVAAVCLALVVVALGYVPTTFGTVVAFNAYLLQFFEPIGMLTQRYTLLQSALAGAERVFKLLDVDEPDAPSSERTTKSTGGPAVSFEQVNFAYTQSAPIINDVSFRVSHGERVAIVGPTGAGKTTLMSLLLRLYDVQRGAICLGSRDVRSFDRQTLRQHFAVVPQHAFLYPVSIAENIALTSDFDEQRVRGILEHMGALKHFESRPRGLHEVLKEQSANFSAGERQIIAFARALYRDAPILILDEATSNLDTETEREVQTALNTLLEGRTALIIAHRLSTVRRADRILVFRQGKLVEQGTYQELLAQGGLFAKLHKLQFTREERTASASAPEVYPTNQLS